MVEADGYILRIATEKWVDQVFNIAIYYTGARRKWKAGQTIVFMHKTSIGDAAIGYGVIENVYERDELSEEERLECEKYGWKKAIEFKYIIKFEKPLPVKETFLKDLKLRGKYLHGLPLNREQLNAIISRAERLQH
ncbi:MAG: hypothetical protein OEZ21_11545 [Candidatus Bathyarchaeota archaeon]|nr:hypothetical protein [Candidatus Bathyarchaeota archaeon]MDH5747566.1 hypothetical protein [Candidatus Bathyarchaeota archaeon]